MSGLSRRLLPLREKLSGRAPLCPWGTALALLNPKTIGKRPPPRAIEITERKDGLVQLRFADQHSFWFPETMPVNDELWSEYLVGTWNSPINFHQYLIPGMEIGEEDIVLDCGACEGFFTRAALDSGARKVICVEPSQIMAKCLGITFAAEIASGRVVIEKLALGANPGTARFSDTDIFGGHITSGEGASVKVSTLDDLAAEHGSLTFLKMDLEGSEFHALSGGVSFLKAKHPKLAITTYHNPWDYAAIRSIIVASGYGSLCRRGVTLRESRTPRPVMIYAR
jgi:FkbM family methyltransferase